MMIRVLEDRRRMPSENVNDDEESLRRPKLGLLKPALPFSLIHRSICRFVSTFMTRNKILQESASGALEY